MLAVGDFISKLNILFLEMKLRYKNFDFIINSKLSFDLYLIIEGIITQTKPNKKLKGVKYLIKVDIKFSVSG